MSLKLKSKFKETVLFDTVEKVPSAKNYGQHSRSKYIRVNSVQLYNSQTSLPQIFADVADSPSGAGQTKSPKSKYTALSTEQDPALDDIDLDENKDFKEIDDQHSDHSDLDEEDHHKSAKQFGTFDGVFGRCLLCMWGVIMFLRTGWIVGNAGVWQTTLVMILSASITMFTTLSLSAICTNGEISHGGPYFLISRSLGPQYGGVIGLLFAVGNCVGVALHLVGFSEAIVSLYYPTQLFGGFDIQFFAEIGLFVLFVIAVRGVGCIIKFNLLLLLLMVISIIVFFVGTFLMTDSKRKLGFTGYSSKTFNDNWNAAYLSGNSFLTMVAIFFPSVTGCMAGANISGDLKKPEKNIPIGTITAVIFSMIVYVIIAWILGATVVRELINPDTGDFIPNTGLYHNYVIMSDISAFRYLVDVGIYASTFSSATSCFVAAPRIFKAVCDDGLFPIFSFFAVGRAKDNEPIRCYILVLIICGLIMLSGDINFIAPMVTNFFLITYSLINYSVFAWDMSKTPGWRPKFKYYSPYLSLFATIQSLILMFLIDWIMALITFVVGILCYIYIDYRDIDVNWGTTVESKLYQQGCKIALKYQKMNTLHAKITRPTFLIMLYENKNENNVKILFKLSSYLNYARGLIFIGNVICGDIDDIEIAKQYAIKRKSYKSFNLNDNILKKCIMETCIADNYQIGTKYLLQTAGMGGMKPNVFMIKIEDETSTMCLNIKNLSHNTPQPAWFTNLRNALLIGLGVIMVPDDFNLEILLNNSHQNTTNHIDIWWLFDDGGLTVLAAYLLTKNKLFKNCKLRIMILDEIGFEDQTEMAYLMAKLRIKAHIQHAKCVKDDEIDDVDDLYNLDDIIIKKDIDDIKDNNDDDASDDTDDNDNLIPDPDDDDNNNNKRQVSEFAYKKIIKYRRVGKTIEKYSSDAKLCLLTMPYPRKKFKWWEYSHIIHDLTPQNVSTMFVRGTQDQVLTFCF